MLGHWIVNMHEIFLIPLEVSISPRFQISYIRPSFLTHWRINRILKKHDHSNQKSRIPRHPQTFMDTKSTHDISNQHFRDQHRPTSTRTVSHSLPHRFNPTFIPFFISLHKGKIVTIGIEPTSTCSHRGCMLACGGYSWLVGVASHWAASAILRMASLPLPTFTTRRDYTCIQTRKFTYVIWTNFHGLLAPCCNHT